MEERLKRVRVVLVGTTHPGNIGSAARAMKAMGVTDLVLVAPERFPHADATALASGADDLLARARVVEDVAAAVSDCVWVVGTSARLRTHSVPVLGPDVAAGQALENAGLGPVALVFGREHSGLTNTELDYCNAFVQIPTVPDFSSLNLAGSVQVMTYALRMAALTGMDPGQASAAGEARDPLATQDEMEGLFRHFEQALTTIEVLDPDNPRNLMRRLRHLYMRAGLTGSEVRMLRGILTHTEKGR
ncbi:RNA methyltransferase [Thioalkalivibrio versutus]|uniref:RNA methyltransferase n=1 Tax=Thioalkalivibrio versutus TaxID=106634 RepID=UPI000381737A|nr:RNA methyltransferase [Thioalkalivibrio versutus]OOC49352.1 tRNA (cytosine(32)/uridine(32)-2'-O)-methyltransferase TrmJ [Thioalkalivibrio versutus]